jgi:hypothetical protein
MPTQSDQAEMLLPAGDGASESRKQGARCSPAPRPRLPLPLLLLMIAAGAGTSWLILSQAAEHNGGRTYSPPGRKCFNDTYSGPSELVTVPCDMRHKKIVYQNVSYNWTLSVGYEQLQDDFFGPRQNVSSILLLMVEDNSTVVLYENHEQTNTITRPIQWVVMRDLASAAGTPASARPYHFKFDLFNTDPDFGRAVPQLYSYPGFNSSEYCPGWATHGTYWTGWRLTQSQSWDC